MLKLAPLIPESATWEGPQPSPLLGKYILDHRSEKISEWLYHGTPYDGLLSMLQGGIFGTEHGEVAEYDTLSTSVNSEVIRLFSEGCGETGLQFKVENASVIVLDDMLLKLVTELVGSGFDAQVDDEEKFEEFCQKFKIPARRGDYYLPYNYLSSLGVDAFTFDYVWKRWQGGHSGHNNDESEICFIGKGVNKLNGLISEIYVDGESFDDKNLAIQALEEKIDDKT